ncbi:MAG: MoxR family ATPase, partial [Chitinophagaceae bacterium]
MKLKNISINNSPVNYIPSAQLVQAAEIAYALKRPLLLSGEPGTGKTDFAKYVAYNLADKGFLPEPLIFNTKSSSSAQDLFYYYDAVAHFRSNSTTTDNNSTENFIQLKALGLAFAHAIGKDKLELSNIITSKDVISGSPVGSVVLIDEIDKAPRDFPNDLLNEIEQYQFEIKEINKKINLNDEQKKNVLLILTSNFEKNLPEAFLRRCVYFHIEFPNAETLQKIIVQRLSIPTDKLSQLQKRIDEFFMIRNDNPVQKKPSTSECLD